MKLNFRYFMVKMWFKNGYRLSAVLRFGVSYLHCSPLKQAVNKAQLSKLRKKTGYPFMKCRNALEQFDNDLEKAESWMHEQAQKEGWAKASKLQERPMSQGLVGLLLENNCAVMVEINCETDFVARNTKFQNLVSRVVTACHKNIQESPKPKVVLDKDGINALTDGENKPLSDMFVLEVGSIGENMIARRATGYRIPPNCHLGHYVHVAGPEIPKIGKCHMGKYSSLVLFQHPPSSDLQLLNEFGRQLAQHVVGMNPEKVGKKDDEPLKNKDEENRMIYQEFLMDPSITVSEYLEQNSATIVDFARFECGEELTDKTKELKAKEDVTKVPAF